MIRKSHLGILPLLLVIGAGLTGCGDNKPTSVSGELPIVEGAYVPETADEGAPIAIEVWGSAPSEGWSLAGFTMGDPSGEIVTVKPYGRGSGGMHGGGMRSPFHGSADVPGLSAGDHTIRIIGSGGRIDCPIHILPRDAMVRMVVRQGGERGTRQLVITNDGAAIAHEAGEGMPGRITLPPDQIDRIRGLFRAAHFMTLDDRYVQHDPPEGLVYAIAFRANPDTAKRVTAEDSAAPQELRDLASQLMQLIDRILQNEPRRPPIVGFVDLDPPVGPPGTARTISLILRNRSADTVAVNFATQQMFDVLVLSGRGESDSLGDGDGGMHGGHHDGMQSVPGHGDPDEPMHHLPVVLWNWAYGQVFGPDPSSLLFLPDEVRTFTFSWPGTANDGTVVGDGFYEVVGQVLTRPLVPVRPAEVAVAPTPPGP
jgi:hypothetical protein